MMAMRFAALAAALAVFWAAPAQACFLPSNVSAIIHDALPDTLPAGLVAAEVEFPEALDEGRFRVSGGDAQILRVLHGAIPARSIWVSPKDGQTSCDYAFANGRRGIIVGRLTTHEGGPALEPVWVVQGDGFRLPPAR